MKVWGNVRLVSVSGNGKTYSALRLNKIQDRRDCKVLLISNERERK